MSLKEWLSMDMTQCNSSPCSSSIHHRSKFSGNSPIRTGFFTQQVKSWWLYFTTSLTIVDKWLSNLYALNPCALHNKILHNFFYFVSQSLSYFIIIIFNFTNIHSTWSTTNQLLNTSKISLPLSIHVYDCSSLVPSLMTAIPQLQPLLLRLLFTMSPMPCEIYTHKCGQEYT